MALLYKTTLTARCVPLQVKHFSGCSFFSSWYEKELEIKKCCKILGVEENCDQEKIRNAYLNLVKRFHPDSGTEEANAEKFHEIDQAFRTLINKKSRERWNVDEEIVVKEQDIKHTAPQHRQYLSFDGVGSGTPSQRQKQYTKVRAMQAVENVYNHRVSKVMADDKALMEKIPLKHKIKTKYGFDRLVEDLIQESMAKGEFSNLKNTGKPLKTGNKNPYVDFVTYKINEVLIDNGFTPEWILLQKEIREEAQLLRKKLMSERQYFGPYPLNVEENIEWSEVVYKYKSTVDKINKKIAKFNLLVPILTKQMVPISFEKEAQRVMVNGESYEDLRPEEMRQKGKNNSENGTCETVSLLRLIDSLFRGK